MSFYCKQTCPSTKEDLLEPVRTAKSVLEHAKLDNDTSAKCLDLLNDLDIIISEADEVDDLLLSNLRPTVRSLMKLCMRRYSSTDTISALETAFYGTCEDLDASVNRLPVSTRLIAFPHLSLMIAMSAG